jgi:hypothetical protein
MWYYNGGVELPQHSDKPYRVASRPSQVSAWRDARALVELTSISELWQRASAAEQRELVRGVFGTVKASPDGCLFALVGLDVGFRLEWNCPHPLEATTRVLRIGAESPDAERPRPRQANRERGKGRERGR